MLGSIQKKLSRGFTVYSNKRIQPMEIHRDKKFVYDSSVTQYSDTSKVYLQRRRYDKKEICKNPFFLELTI